MPQNSCEIHMCCVTLPHRVIKEIDRLRRSFLWKGKSEALGSDCLVAWDQVCRSTAEGGLGVKNLLIDTYRDATCVQIGDGACRSLWRDKWTSNGPLYTQFPALFSHTTTPNISLRSAAYECQLNLGLRGTEKMKPVCMAFGGRKNQSQNGAVQTANCG